MSWDVLVLNYEGSPPASVEEMAENDNPQPLGKSPAVQNAISEYLPEVDWSEPTWGIYEGDGFTIEFNISEEDTIESLMLHVRGSGDAIATLIQFAQPNNWSLFDCSTSEFLDFANPSKAGWEGFQEFRDQAIKKKPKGRS